MATDLQPRCWHIVTTLLSGQITPLVPHHIWPLLQTFVIYQNINTSIYPIIFSLHPRKVKLLPHLPALRGCKNVSPILRYIVS